MSIYVYHYNPFAIEKGPQACKQGQEMGQPTNYVILNILAPHLFREVCWMVEKRGFVGESVFHVCFLMQTPTHLFLGRRLLKHYPKLINDIYMSEEYYGENVLHMSCVAEDPTMVKYLLDQGIGMK